MNFKEFINIYQNESWEVLEKQFSWFKDMKDVPQDKIHHAEGNVAIHTQMVLKELINLKEYQSLNQAEQEILWTSALLHDVEKRSTTLEENGRITARRHAKKGAVTSRKILYKDIVTPFVIREQIVKLVQFHGLPLWAFEKENPLKTLVLTSCEISMKLLYILSKADVLGRICHDQDEYLYRLELFKEWCIEQNCWEQEKSFNSNSHRFLYFSKENVPFEYEPFEEEKFEVILLVGLPGTGKDYYCATHYKELPIVSLDKFREEYKILPSDTKGTGKVVQYAKEASKEYLRKKQSFVFNATNIVKNLRSQWVDLFVMYGAKVKIVYLEVSYQKMLAQNQNREAIVPEKIIEKMLTKMEIPAQYEAHSVDYNIR